MADDAASWCDPERLLAGYLHFRRRWPQLQMLADGAIWMVGVYAATALRFDLQLELFDGARAAVAAALSAATFMTAGLISGLYRRRFKYGSFDELATLAACSTVTLAVLFAFVWVQDSRPVPASVPFIAASVAVLGMVAVRYVARAVLQQLLRPGDAAEPVLIFGAGDAGIQLVRSMQRTPGGRYRPVGLLDDNPAKAAVTVEGVRGLGDRTQLAAAAAATGAKVVVLAMPSADGVTIRALVEAAGQAGLRVKTLPSVSELVSPLVESTDIRPITEADLLGRRQIDTDVETIADYVRGKRVLVTGAGGSIGSELCRQLHQFEPEQLVLLDRDESALHAVQLSIEGRALLDTPNLVVADIRDAERMHEVFRLHQPDVVFHAAALKHLPLLEMHPEEGVKTNVWGTQHVLDAARAVGVTRFVNISTDKAANPSSVLGYTKRIAERLTAAVAQETGLHYLSVRFGNVLGSRGSVVPAFQAMIDAGGPVTVTHPEVTRFFMTVPEAVQLVIQAGAIGAPGEVLILDMGQPVRIADVAKRLIEASGKPVEIIFTGLRPGEKMHEELVAETEVGVRSQHPLITHAVVPPIAASAAAEQLGRDGIRSGLVLLAGDGAAPALGGAA